MRKIVSLSRYHGGTVYFSLFVFVMLMVLRTSGSVKSGLWISRFTSSRSRSRHYYLCTNLLTFDDATNIAMGQKIKNDDGQTIVHSQ